MPISIIANATYMGRHMFGSSSNAIWAHSWRIDQMATHNITIKIAVAEDDCSPLYESLYGVPGGG